MTNVYEFRRRKVDDKQTVQAIAYDFGHGMIGERPTDDYVKEQTKAAEQLAQTVSDQIGSDEPLVDAMDILDALATLGYKLVQLRPDETSVPSWAFWQLMEELNG